MALTEFLSVFAESGLVFILMALAIYFLAKAYIRVQKKYENAVDAFNDYLKETQARQVEIITNFNGLLKAIKEGFDNFKR